MALGRMAWEDRMPGYDEEALKIARDLRTKLKMAPWKPTPREMAVRTLVLETVLIAWAAKIPIRQDGDTDGWFVGPGGEQTVRLSPSDDGALRLQTMRAGKVEEVLPVKDARESHDERRPPAIVMEAIAKLLTAA